MKFHVVLSIVGAVMFFLGSSMLVPLLVSLHYRDGCAGVFGLSAGMVMTAGLALFLSLPRKRHQGDLSLKDGFGIVTFSWFGASFVGAIPFWLSGAIPQFAHAFFEATSGLTTTGASILSDIEALPRSMLFWRGLLNWLGGMGIIVLSVAILPFLGLGGMQLYKAESPGPTKDKLRPRIQQTAKLLYGVYILITVACLLLLLASGMDLYDATCHTFSTVSTGGFSTYNTSIAHFKDPMVHYIIIFFLFISGINFAYHYRALSGHWTCYARSEELRFYTFLALACTLGVFLFLSHRGADNELLFRQSLFNVVSILTCTGFANADFEQWVPGAQVLLLVVMFVGGCAGSTSGGLKVVRALLLLKYLKVMLKQQLHPSGVFVIKLDGQIVKREVLQNILGMLLVFILLHMTASALLAFLGMDLVTAVTATLTCISNAGPGLGLVGPTDNFSVVPPAGIWVLNVCMIMGRLEIFSVLILLMPQTWRR
jgi:trk system potassium uptake protein TrkH